MNVALLQALPPSTLRPAVSTLLLGVGPSAPRVHATVDRSPCRFHRSRQTPVNPAAEAAEPKIATPEAIPLEEDPGPVVDIVRVPFDGGHIEAVKRDDGIWTIFKPMCETLNIDAEGQRQRIMRESWAKGTTCKLQAVAADGKVREQFALRADMIAAWLFGVQTGSIREDLRPKLDKLKNDAAKVLGAYFTPAAAEAAGIDVEAIGAALLQTGRQLREQRDRIAQLEAHVPIAAQEAVKPLARRSGCLRSRETTCAAWRGASLAARRPRPEAHSDRPRPSGRLSPRVVASPR